MVLVFCGHPCANKNNRLDPLLGEASSHRRSEDHHQAPETPHQPWLGERDWAVNP